MILEIAEVQYPNLTEDGSSRSSTVGAGKALYIIKSYMYFYFV